MEPEPDFLARAGASEKAPVPSKYLNLCKKIVIQSREPEPKAGTGAGQDWTGSTTLAGVFRIRIRNPDPDPGA